MPSFDPAARSASTIAAAVLAAGLAGCDSGPELVTSIEFDGQDHTITTTSVACTRQPDGALVILVSNGPRRSVRAQLTLRGHLVVQKVGLRYEDISGFVEDPREVTATKVDHAFTFSGRMPPNPGESQWHLFSIETTCPGYDDAPPPKVGPQLGTP